MSRWRHLIFDAITREPQAELPAVGDATYSDVLNSPGAASVTLHMDDAGGVDASMILPPRAIYGVERDDILVWAGPVIGHDYNLRARTVTLTCEGWWNYMRRRFVTTPELSYTNVDQTQIAKNLINYTATWTGGDMQIGYSGWSLTGVLRNRTYYYYEHGSIGTLIEQLGAVNNGFDWRLVPSWSSGPNSTMQVDFATSYPATGRLTNIILDLDANTAVEQVLLDSSNLSYVAIIEGLGQGEDQHNAIFNNNAKITANLRLESVEAHSDVSDPATLTDYSQRRLIRGAECIVIPKLNVSTDFLADLIMGDQVRVRADMGLLQVDATYRITSWEVKPGDERMTMTLAPLTAFV